MSVARKIIKVHPLEDEEYEGIVAVLNGTQIIKGKASNLSSIEHSIKGRVNDFYLDDALDVNQKV